MYQVDDDSFLDNGSFLDDDNTFTSIDTSLDSNFPQGLTPEQQKKRENGGTRVGNKTSFRG